MKTAAEPLTDMLKDEKTELEMNMSLELLYPVFVDWNTEKLQQKNTEKLQQKTTKVKIMDHSFRSA